MQKNTLRGNAACRVSGCCGAFTCVYCTAWLIGVAYADHLPLGQDGLKAHGICLRLAEKAERRYCFCHRSTLVAPVFQPIRVH